MNGLIIFADDDVLDSRRSENGLFNRFLKSNENLTVIPVTTIEGLESTLKSVTTIRCLILDWSFEYELEEGITKKVNPKDFLLNCNIYGLIYLYSREEIADSIKDELSHRFGSKIKFKNKGTNLDSDEEFNEIITEIKSLENENSHMAIPKQWSQAINCSMQSIFSDLEKADHNWILEIRDASINDSGDAAADVIGIFQNILTEEISHNDELRSSIMGIDTKEETKPDSKVAELYRRILYSNVNENAPIMTGDIFAFEDDLYGIVITPECQVSSLVDDELAFLTFKANAFKQFAANKYNKNYEIWYPLMETKNKNKEECRKLFNNADSSFHILPSFPFKGNLDQSAHIDFRNAFKIFPKEKYNGKRTGYRLMGPYIHQLRQRYISFFGRYGVPALPLSLRDFNLKWDIKDDNT